MVSRVMAVKHCVDLTSEGDFNLSYRITSSITKTTTPTEFDGWCRAHPEYQLQHGGRCGWHALGCAAHHANLNLVQHLLNQPSASKLVNLGNNFGWTPLMCAVAELRWQHTRPVSDWLEIIHLLLKAGADPNLATSCWCGDSNHGDTPAGVTPLWMLRHATVSAAVKRSDDELLPVVNLLLAHGALDVVL